MSKYLILGAKGVLGTTLSLDLQSLGNEVLRVSRSDIDLFNQEAVATLLNKCGPATIVNCTAFMPADKCETNPIESNRINVDLIEKLSSIIRGRIGFKLIQFSSDFIFDGESAEPYTENSQPNPISVYGLHKFESEKIVTNQLGEQGLIIRFASLVSHSADRKTFLEKVIDRAKSSQEISLVDDLIISTATSDLISNVVAYSDTFTKQLVHAVHLGSTSWYKIATCALDALGIPTVKKVVPSSTFPTVAERPMYSVLRPSDEIVAIDNRNWDTAVSEYVANNLR